MVNEIASCFAQSASNLLPRKVLTASSCDYQQLALRDRVSSIHHGPWVVSKQNASIPKHLNRWLLCLCFSIDADICTAHAYIRAENKTSTFASDPSARPLSVCLFAQGLACKPTVSCRTPTDRCQIEKRLVLCFFSLAPQLPLRRVRF
jgi:hypothetical protein